MAEFPALPLWTDAYLADTRALSVEEHGYYLLLLMTIWRSPGCRVPDDDQWLAKRFGLDPVALHKKLRPIIREFCQSDGGSITQKRLLKEWEYCVRLRQRQSAAAKKRWQKAATPPADRKPLKTNKKNDASAYATPDLLNLLDNSICHGSTEVLEVYEQRVHKKNKSLKTNDVDACHGNAPTPHIKKERKKEPLATLGGADAPGIEFELFARGKAVLGENAGGLIAKLLKAQGGNHTLALAAILTASTKQNPREYVGALLRGQPSGEPFYDPAI